jgi:Flp pilus assembly protein TadG
MHRYSIRRQLRRSLRRARRGKILVATALALPLLLTLCAYAVGVTFLLGTEVKLNAVTEAAASAAADVYGATRHPGLARDAAQRVAANNTIQGASLTIENDDIEIGRYHCDGPAWSFVPGGRPANAVRVTGRVAGGNAFGRPACSNFWMPRR